MSTVRKTTPPAGGLDRAIDGIDRAIARSRELAVMMVMVHGVDRLCATVGHVHTSEIMNDFCRRLAEICRDDDAVMRLSDRKFVVLLGAFRNRGHVQLAAQKIERLIQRAPVAGMGQQALKVAIGIAFVPGEHGGGAHDILRSAEMALLDGCHNNESVAFYHAKSADKLIAEWSLEHKLADALEAGSLELHYQPKISLASREITGVEALIRWHDPELGTITPDVIIAAAEESNLIADLTYFSIQRACRQLNQWSQWATGLTVAVNITPRTIQDLEIIDVLESATRIWNVAAGLIVLEVTENALMVDPKTSHGILTGIREFGARVSIDDFGTGYSSLAYLKELPADELKIDRSFVMGMLADPGDYKIVEHAISIAGSFGLQVVAEGVLNEETLDALRALGCDSAQGYHICEPMPADDFLSWYLARHGHVEGPPPVPADGRDPRLH